MICFERPAFFYDFTWEGLEESEGHLRRQQLQNMIASPKFRSGVISLIEKAIGGPVSLSTTKDPFGYRISINGETIAGGTDAEMALTHILENNVVPSALIYWYRTNILRIGSPAKRNYDFRPQYTPPSITDSLTF